MKKALVVEGGAMRGIFAAGVLDGFLKRDMMDFDLAVGVSAGATNLATYITQAQGLSRTIISEYATRREFFSPLRFIRGGHMTDVHWLWQQCKNALPSHCRAPVDTIPLHVGITNVDTGDCEYHRVSNDNIDDLMVASCAIPTAYREQPVIDGKRYTDGGVADPIPAQKAYAMGARDITVVLSQPLSFAKPDIRSAWLLERLYGRQPQLMQAILNRADVYNHTREWLESPPKDCSVTVIAPDEAFRVRRLTMHRRKLALGYRSGLTAARRFLRGQQYAA
ncbi:patatin-like phospholipase family protein [Alteromonas halophila]|uniref:Patatin family protein n=1 Tax=Alteromonas halophila TaxID=516698 RepID=A0A918JNC8_9ALTE|nr:patatin family protein [Alteromonas halophila]GGW88067.1 patatin family protein [Alteromonas halophila]